jgi:hypothetical protein
VLTDVGITIALISVQFPYMPSMTPVVKVSVGVFSAPVQFISRQFAVASMVTVCAGIVNELAVKYTLSELVGKEAFGAPPSAADQ